jgi:hypothetical protein
LEVLFFIVIEGGEKNTDWMKKRKPYVSETPITIFPKNPIHRLFIA